MTPISESPPPRATARASALTGKKHNSDAETRAGAGGYGGGLRLTDPHRKGQKGFKKKIGEVGSPTGLAEATSFSSRFPDGRLSRLGQQVRPLKPASENAAAQPGVPCRGMQLGSVLLPPAGGTSPPPPTLPPPGERGLQGGGEQEGGRALGAGSREQERNPEFRDAEANT